MEPNCKPLEAKLGAPRCAGFMFMGRSNGINHYKHGLSRRYLFLDDVGRAYEAAGRNEFREIPFDEALARVEEGGGLPALAVTRSGLEESLGMTFQGERGDPVAAPGRSRAA